MTMDEVRAEYPEAVRYVSPWGFQKAQQEKEEIARQEELLRAETNAKAEADAMI